MEKGFNWKKNFGVKEKMQPDVRIKDSSSFKEESSNDESISMTDTAPGQLRVIKRNGAVVAYDESKISVAITKAYLAVEGGQAAALHRTRTPSRDKQTFQKFGRHFAGETSGKTPELVEMGRDPPDPGRSASTQENVTKENSAQENRATGTFVDMVMKPVKINILEIPLDRGWEAGDLQLDN